MDVLKIDKKKNSKENVRTIHLPISSWGKHTYTQIHIMKMNTKERNHESRAPAKGDTRKSRICYCQ